MFILLIIVMSMVLTLAVLRLIWNVYMKRRLIMNFAYRLPNSEIEFNQEYVKCLKTLTIDQQVIDDLELNEVFKKCDYTYTNVGREYMYGRMFEENPQHDLLEDIILQLQRPQVLSQSVYALYQLSRQYSASLNLFENTNVLTQFDKTGIFILMIIPFVLIASYFFIGVAVGFFAFIYIVVMMASYSYYNRKTDHFMSQALSYCYLVNCLNQLMKAKVFPAAEEAKIKPMIAKAKSYTMLTRVCQHIEKVDVFYAMEFINGLFLIPIHQCLILLKHKDELAPDLIDIYRYVGSVDLAVSVLTLRKNYSTCIPQSVEEPAVHFIEAYHPLLKNPIKNSFSSHESCIITGSNASGKSTFIKMIGVNMIMAKTLHTCFAEEWVCYPFQLCTSIHMKDDIESGESYFVKEIKTLKNIVDNAKSQKCLIFIDEILRGTNEKERVAISKVILKTLFESQSLVFVTTHDLSIIQDFESIQKYCFNDYIEDHQLCCDYKIHEGICHVGNAIALLDVYGFSSDITNQLKKPN